VNILAQVDIQNTFKSPIGTSVSIGDLISTLLTVSITIAGIIILFLFLFGGISIIAGAGKNNPESVEKGKKAITSAVIGFIVVFAAFWIIQLIELMTGSNFITAPGL
jgi:hypothetical protein